MIYLCAYSSPTGEITIAAEAGKIIGLWFDGQKYDRRLIKDSECTPLAQTDLTCELKFAVRWLDIYFSGREPDFTPPLRLSGSEFRQTVSEIMLTIPYGSTMTYKEIAEKAAQMLGKERMSAQAVGGAVGHNDISLIVPCHRVIGTDGSLTGYAGGIEKKEYLLKLEKNGKATEREI